MQTVQSVITGLSILPLTDAEYIDAVMQLAALLFVGISASNVNSGETHAVVGFSAPHQDPPAPKLCILDNQVRKDDSQTYSSIAGLWDFVYSCLCSIFLTSCKFSGVSSLPRILSQEAPEILPSALLP